MQQIASSFFGGRALPQNPGPGALPLDPAGGTAPDLTPSPNAFYFPQT